MLPVLKIHFCLNCHHWTFFTKKVMEYMCICFCCANIRQFWNQDGGRRVQLWASMSPLDLWEPGFVLIFFSRKGHLQLRGEEPDPFVRCQGMLHAFHSFIHSFILSSIHSLVILFILWANIFCSICLACWILKASSEKSLLYLSACI